MKTRQMKSAEGATFITSLGQRPGVSRNPNSLALKARLFPEIGVGLNRPIESRFQRWFSSRRESWGDAPGLHESAPLALNTNICGMRDRRS